MGHVWEIPCSDMQICTDTYPIITYTRHHQNLLEAHLLQGTFVDVSTPWTRSSDSGSGRPGETPSPPSWARWKSPPAPAAVVAATRWSWRHGPRCERSAVPASCPSHWGLEDRCASRSKTFFLQNTGRKLEETDFQLMYSEVVSVCRCSDVMM